MKKILILGLFLISLFFPLQAEATINRRTDPPNLTNNLDSFFLIFESDSDFFTPNQNYSFGFEPGPGFVTASNMKDPRILKFQINRKLGIGTHKYRVWLGTGPRDYNQNTDIPELSGSLKVEPPGNIGGTTGLPALAMDQSNFQAKTPADIYILNPGEGEKYRLWFDGELIALTDDVEVNKVKATIFSSKYHDRTIKITIKNIGDPSAKNLCMKSVGFSLGGSVASLSCDFRLKGIVVTSRPPATLGDFLQSNKTAPGSSVLDEPVTALGPCGLGFCKTALGKIFTDPANFVRSFFGILLSLAGGIAIILIILSGYRLMSSGGNPEKVQAAREQLTSAIVGLLFIIFSLSILQIIGVDILHIPGLTK